MLNKGRYFFFVMFFMLIITAVFLVAADNTPTKVNVPNSPPFLVKEIPDQSWAFNTNLLNAFNLNDYFESLSGNNLTYTYTLPENITVLMTPEGEVSFYPNSGYNGTSTIKFTAHDGSLSGESNLVSLNVEVDTEPPKWSNPSYNPLKIYQNTYVNFNTTWTDNLQLSKSIFSIYQGGVWENYSKSFSGVLNTSSERIQISAPGGSIIFWYFCGYDTSNNFNCTSIKNFTVLNHQKVYPSEESNPSSGPTSPNEFYIQIPKFARKKPFEVSEDFFKISLKQGSSKTRFLKISNKLVSKILFNLGVNSLGNFTKLSTKNFSLDKGDSKVITIDFSVGRYVSPGEYFGALLISSSFSNSVMQIPIVIDVNPYVLGFKVNVTVPESYKNVNPGKEIIANISISNLKDPPNSPVHLYYAVKDFSGNIYNYSFSNLTLSNNLNLVKSLKIPLAANPGNYLFYARVSLENESAIDSDAFQVGTSFNFDAVFKYGSILFAIFVLTILSMVLFFKYRREHEKKKLLNLYLMVSLLKKLIEEGNTESALNLFIRIKSAYGEKVSESAFENKEKLKEEINMLSEKLKKQVGQESSSKKTESENSEEKDSQDSKDGQSSEEKEGDSKGGSEKEKSPIGKKGKEEKDPSKKKQTILNKKRNPKKILNDKGSSRKKKGVSKSKFKKLKEGKKR